jgi:hypothetical protein
MDEIKEKNRFGQLLQAKCMKKKTFPGENETKWQPQPCSSKEQLSWGKKEQLFWEKRTKLPRGAISLKENLLND